MLEDGCCICGAKKIFLEVGIGFGMYGEEYQFCRKCLKAMSAEQMFKKIFKHLQYAWPPKKVSENV